MKIWVYMWGSKKWTKGDAVRLISARGKLTNISPALHASTQPLQYTSSTLFLSPSYLSMQNTRRWNYKRGFVIKTEKVCVCVGGGLAGDGWWTCVCVSACNVSSGGHTPGYLSPAAVRHDGSHIGKLSTPKRAVWKMINASPNRHQFKLSMCLLAELPPQGHL